MNYKVKKETFDRLDIEDLNHFKEVSSYNHNYYIYILTNKNNTVLYTGITNSHVRRNREHKEGVGSGFTKKYQVNKLVYFEVFSDVKEAIQREKQIKAGSRQKKLNLINKYNEEWVDLGGKI